MERPERGADAGSSGLDYFPGLMEREVLEAIFRQLVANSGDSQDSPSLRNWFYEILRTCRGTTEFMQAMAAARRFKPESGKPFFHAPLAATPSYRLSLVGMHPRKPIPLHDHPGAWSAQMVLAGHARIRHYDIHRKAPGDTPRTYLQAASLRDFGVNEISTVTPQVRNIHSLTAITVNTVWLSIHHIPVEAPRPSWFFPVDPSRWKEPLLLCHQIDQNGSVMTGGLPLTAGSEAGNRRTRRAA